MNRRTPLFVGIGAAVVVLLVALILVVPKFSSVGKAKEQLSAAEAEETTLTNEVVQLEELKKQAPEFQRQLETARAQVPDNPDMPGLIRTLQNVANKTGVDFAVLGVSNPAPADTADFSTISMSITINGTFFQVAQYLFEIEHLRRALKVTNTSITASTYPVLVGALTTEAYTASLSSGPGTVPTADTGSGTSSAASPSAIPSP